MSAPRRLLRTVSLFATACCLSGVLPAAAHRDVSKAPAARVPVRQAPLSADAVNGVWSQIAPPSSAGSPSGHGAIYEPARDAMLVFGGFYLSAPNPYSHDTWRLSLGDEPTWTPLAPVGPLPDERAGSATAYDAVGDRMVVFGGNFVPADPPGLYYSDAWALDLAGAPAWTRWAPAATEPAARVNPSGIYDPARRRFVLFGGWMWTTDASIAYDDVWALACEGTHQWTELTPAGPGPGGRWGHTAVYDPVRDRMLVFGGMDASYALYNDVWALSLSGAPAWTRLSPAGTPPATRRFHSAIYDPVRDRMVVMGGEFRGNEVWGLSLAGSPAWTRLTPTGTPPARASTHSAIYDPLRDRMLVYGGGAEQVFALTWGTPLRRVAIDIRPGDDQNVVNPGAHGVLPVAILSEAGFDATTVDPLSVTLAGAGVRVRPNGSPMAFREDVNGDRRADLVLHVETDELQLAPADTVAHLTAIAPGGLSMAGSDRVRVVGSASHPPRPGGTPGSGAVTEAALLAVRSVPGMGVRVSLALAPGAPATLDLIAVTGRRVRGLALDDGGAGTRELTLGGARLAPGIYWVRLRQADRVVTRKTVLLR